MNFSLKFVLNIVIIIAAYHIVLNLIKSFLQAQLDKLQKLFDEMEEHDKKVKKLYD